jgi:uncharacterized protein (TIGR03085 family)
MSHYARSERAALVDLLDRLGPDEPTRCEGWTTGDLGAHLVVRERRPDAALGIVVPPLAGYSERVRIRVRDRRAWPELLATIGSGPPAPWRPIDEAVNTIEYFVHHEDVRRAQPGWAPRALEPEEEDALWRRLKAGLRLATRRAPGRIVLMAPGRPELTAGKGEPAVTVAGAPGEIVLFVLGRGAVAQVELHGDPAAVERLRAARLGL